MSRRLSRRSLLAGVAALVATKATVTKAPAIEVAEQFDFIAGPLNSGPMTISADGGFLVPPDIDEEIARIFRVPVHMLIGEPRKIPITQARNIAEVEDREILLAKIEDGKRALRKLIDEAPDDFTRAWHEGEWRLLYGDGSGRPSGLFADRLTSHRK